MRTPSALRSLDDRVLGDRLRRRRSRHDQPEEEHASGGAGSAQGPPPSTGDGAREALGVFARISRLVLLLLAAVVVLAIAFILAPANEDNVIVSTVLDLADRVAGPFRDVFTVDDDPERETVVNYVLAAVVYAVAAALVGRLRSTRS